MPGRWSRLGLTPWPFALTLAVVALTVAIARPGPAGRADAQTTAAASMIDVTFGPGEIWTPSQSANLALHECHNTDFSCVQPIMQNDGASADAIAFYHLTGWFLSDIKDAGVVQLATVLNPWRANENDQPALLGGIPAAVYPEQQAELIDLAGTVQNDPTYAGLKAAHPNIMFWGPGPTLETTETSPDGGPRFIFGYRLLDGCHACAILGKARVAFDFASDGTFTGARFLNIAQTSSGS